MPFKSQKQKAWAADQVTKGKWTQSQFNEWNSATPANIPDKVVNKKPPIEKLSLTKVGKVKKI